MFKSGEQRFRDTPQPFGIPARPERKLRSLVISLPDDEETEDFVPLPPSVATADQAFADAAPLGVFDPAETDIPLEEIDRPVEPSMSQEEAEKRWKVLCGEQEDVQAAAEIGLFTPENYLLVTILEGLRRSRELQQTVQIKFSSQDYALLMPTQSLAYCTLDTRSDEFAMLCNNPVQTGRIALHIPSSAELDATGTAG